MIVASYADESYLYLILAAKIPITKLYHFRFCLENHLLCLYSINQFLPLYVPISVTNRNKNIAWILF